MHWLQRRSHMTMRVAAHSEASRQQNIHLLVHQALFAIAIILQKNYSDIISLAFKIMTSHKSLRVHLEGMRVAEKLILCPCEEPSVARAWVDAFSSTALNLRKLVFEDGAGQVVFAIWCLGMMCFRSKFFY